MDNIFEKSATPLRLTYGIAKKSGFDMSAAERLQVAHAALERAKEIAFTHGLPIIYGENGYVIAEYADGKRFIHDDGKDIKIYNG
jgi:hypothetical protein